MPQCPICKKFYDDFYAMFPQYRNQPPFYYLKSRDGRTYILSPLDSATINYDKKSAHFRAITTILAKEYKPTLQNG